MKTILLLGASVAISTSVLAETSSKWSATASLGASSLSEDLAENESMSYQLLLGYHFSSHMEIEAGYADYLMFNENFDYRPGLLNIKASAPLSDVAGFYFGAGLAYQSSPAPLAKAGIVYQVSDNWHLDVGYQRVFDIEELGNDDLHTFLIGGSYKFGGEMTSFDDQSDTQLRPSTQEEKDNVEDVNDSTPNLEPKPEVKCQEVIENHIVKEGEYLISIAEKYNMQLLELLELNSKGFDGSRNLDLIYPKEVFKIKSVICTQ
ncbi:outer membrane beta-barrel protein [Vibrio parahaemolyticus]|nr:LysM peptidoglycan-binding domain-containing protein [Vibrio parahaemolyticus]EGR2875480.1 LysM peptidoglycan-binding domain-containing protein [Vibrio parahaemolyticus]EJC7067011.1 outer membrane beta-barrel protein [Vibrio parahaemolyticus]EJF9997108.1 outer membrane beta-barrel protein [Vibrio parahaemolyticus]EJG0582526.1 outer membrane beta-barrel protein [Vibrio parahaemolyticus]